MSSQITTDKELIEKLSNGVLKLTKTTGLTLGPKGRTVILKKKNGKPICTKDGITVARDIVSDDLVENIAIDILRQASESQLTQCGDGTTTSLVLCGAIFEQVKEMLLKEESKSYSMVDIKKGMELALDAIKMKLDLNAKEVKSLEEIENIATISANGDKEIGKLISSAVEQIGRDGAITIQESHSSETFLEVTEGFMFDSGLYADAFKTDQRRGILKYENCLVLITDKGINSLDEILPLLEKIARDGRPFIIVADQIDNQVLSAMIFNAAKGAMKIACIKSPRYGEERKQILEDLALTLGGEFISRDKNYNFASITLDQLGQAKLIESGKNSTTVVSYGNNQLKIDERIQLLKEQIMNLKNINDGKKIQERITRLASGIAVVKVGALTEIEMIEKKHRIEDALEAVAAAQDQGILPGGSSIFVKINKDLKKVLKEIDWKTNSKREISKWLGYELVVDSLLAPIRVMLTNAGMNEEEIIAIIADIQQHDFDSNIGYDVLNDQFVDMLEKGIIDPLKVSKFAVNNAVSAVGTLLHSAATVHEI